MMTTQTDQVADQLASASTSERGAFVSWLTFCSEREALLRRASQCALAGWLVITVIAVLSTVMAVYFHYTTHTTLDLFQRPLRISSSLSAVTDNRLQFWDAATFEQAWLSIAFLATCCMICVISPLAWRWNCIPGFRNLRNTIDLTTIGNAMNRLLSLGVPYPTAFRVTASTLHCVPQRRWLEEAANRVEAGHPTIAEAPHCHAESDLLINLMSRSDTETHHDWLVIAKHYEVSAQRKLSLLLGATPVASTITAALILWFSLATTLGSFWSKLSQFTSDLGF